jgi:coproporphyrinogen III oxidase-like Fe-S oxidoreductase
LADISKENGFKKIILENEIEELASLGLLEKDALTIKLTEKGRLYSNEVISRFI